MLWKANDSFFFNGFVNFKDFVNIVSKAKNSCGVKRLSIIMKNMKNFFFTPHNDPITIKEALIFEVCGLDVLAPDFW